MDNESSTGRRPPEWMPSVKRLLREMENLDPAPVELDWDSLSEREREYYRLCALAVLDEASLEARGRPKLALVKDEDEEEQVLAA